jgi:hypothetical protein
MSNWHLEETYKSLILIGTSALKFVLLANGGAAIAVLAFVGELSAKQSDPPALYLSLGCFLAGVFFGGLSHLTGYVTQLVLYNEEKGGAKGFFKKHEPWLYVSLLLVLSGIVCFGVGAWSGVTSLLDLAHRA